VNNQVESLNTQKARSFGEHQKGEVALDRYDKGKN
jgi:hypothetical protein